MLAPYANKPDVARATPNATDEDLKATIAKVDARGWQVMTHAIGDARDPAGARRLRARGEDEPRAGARTAAPHRAHRDHRPRRHPAVRRARRDRRACSRSTATRARTRSWCGRATSGEDRASRGLGLPQHPQGRRPARVRQRLAGGHPRPARGPHRRGEPHHAGRRPRRRVVPGRTHPAGAGARGLHQRRGVRVVRRAAQGPLAKGQLADLVVFSKDLFALPAAKLLDAQVTHTIFDGRVVYERRRTTRRRRRPRTDSAAAADTGTGPIPSVPVPTPRPRRDPPSTQGRACPPRPPSPPPLVEHLPFRVHQLHVQGHLPGRVRRATEARVEGADRPPRRG